jgi:hypothetical protein
MGDKSIFVIFVDTGARLHRFLLALADDAVIVAHSLLAHGHRVQAKFLILGTCYRPYRMGMASV